MTSPMLEKFWSFVDRKGSDECWLWTGRAINTRCGLKYGGFGRSGRAHRISWEIANGRPVPKGLVVRHKCDVSLCVNPNHLETGTLADNVRDRDERNRTYRPKGEAHPMNKLRTEEVLEIRRLSASGVSYSELAERFNVSGFGIYWAVKRGWKHLNGDTILSEGETK